MRFKCLRKHLASQKIVFVPKCARTHVTNRYVQRRCSIQNCRLTNDSWKHIIDTNHIFIRKKSIGNININTFPPHTCLILLPVASLWTLYLQTLWSYTTKPIFCNCLLVQWWTLYFTLWSNLQKKHKQFCRSICYNIFLPSSILHDVSNYQNF